MKKMRKSLLFLQIFPLLFGCKNTIDLSSKIDELLVSRDNVNHITIYDIYFSSNSYKENGPFRAKQMYDKITSFLKENNYDEEMTKLVNSDNGEKLTNMYTGINVLIFGSNDFKTSIYITKYGYTYLTRVHYDALVFNSTGELYSYLYSYIN